MQKGYRCYCLNLNKYIVSADVTFLEQTPFVSSSGSISPWEDNDLLIYTLTSPRPDLLFSTPVKPPIQ